MNTSFPTTVSALILSIVFLITVNASISNQIVVPIPKYCSVGYVATFEGGCLKVVEGVNWTGVLYDRETLQRLDSDEDKEVERNYVYLNFSCKYEDTILQTKPPTPNEKPL